MKFNISFKIVILFTIIVAAVFLGISSYLYYSLTQDAYERIRSRLLKETRLAAAFVDKYVTQRPLTYGVDGITDLISKDIDAHVTITGLYGTVIGDSELDGGELKGAENLMNKPEVREALKSKYGYDSRMSEAMNKRMFYVATTFGKERPEGFIRLALPLSDVESISGRLKKILIIAVPASFVISIVAVFIASFFISKPIKSVEHWAKSLAESFSHMSDEMKAKMEEIDLDKSKMDAILRGLDEGVAVLDSNGKILAVNEHLGNFLKMDESPFGKKPKEALRNAEIQKIADQALSSKEGVSSDEISVSEPEKKRLLVHATPIVRHGNTDGAVLVFHDTTKQKIVKRRKKNVKKSR